MRMHKVVVAETLLGDFTLKFLEIKGKKDGPTLGIVSGIHGHELSSIGGLIEFWEEFIAVKHRNIAGRVIILPFANPLGLMLMEREVEENDPNRSFPGNPKGALADRMAYSILSFFKKEKVDLVIDIHTMNPLSVPHIIIDQNCVYFPEIKSKTLSLADMFGIGVVIDFPYFEYKKEKLDSSLTAQMIEHGIPSFTVEVPGENYSPSCGEKIVSSGLWNMVRGLGIIKDRKPDWRHFSKETLGTDSFSYFLGPVAEHAGFLKRLVEPGEKVLTGQILGEIRDSSCAVTEQIKALRQGYIADIINASIISAGERPFTFFVQN